MIPGEILHGADSVTINTGRPALTLLVANTGDRPVQVRSHFHFAQANAALRFDRDARGPGTATFASAGSPGSPANRAGNQAQLSANDYGNFFLDGTFASYTHAKVP